MAMVHYQLLVFICLLSTFTTICSSSLFNNNQHDKQIQLQPPHLTGNYDSERSSIELRNTKTRVKSKSRASMRKDASFPCNGSSVRTNGTTCGLKQIMIGRCLEYQYAKPIHVLSNQTTMKNCTQLYYTFESAVRYKSYCDVNMTTYEKYFEQALTGVRLINRAMFWSGTYAVTHSYSANGLNYITLEDTLAAMMVNGLVWCGKENDTDGYDFLSCPNNCKDNKWADLAFWGLASKTFAQLASGEIFVVLNGSQSDGRPAFRNTSYFAQFELPNLKQNGSDRVTKVNTLILHSPDRTIVEKCGEKSLKDLEQLIRNQGFDYVCKDDPEELILIMCGDEWEARECQIARRVLRQAWDTKLYGLSKSEQNSPSIIVFLFICLINLVLH